METIVVKEKPESYSLQCEEEEECKIAPDEKKNITHCMRK
jgi:hypothetical protein